jgi:ABC-type multidrug transport system fused ATPase/permease subunit
VSWCRFYPARTTALLLIILLGALSELLCISVLVPLMDFIVQAGGQDTKGSATIIKSMFERFGVPYNLPIFLTFSLGLVTVSVFLGYLREILTAHIWFRSRKRLRDKAFNNIVDSSLSYIWSQQGGHLLNILTAEIDVAARGINALVLIVASCILFAGYTVLLLAISWHMVIFVIIIVVLKYAASVPFIRRSRRLSGRMLTRANDQSTSLLNMLQGIFLIKSFSTEKVHQDKFADATKEFSEVQIENAINTARLSLFDNLLTPVIICVLTYLGLAVFKLPTSMLIVFLVGLKRTAPLISQIHAQRNGLSIMAAATTKIMELLDRTATPHLRSGTRQVTEMTDCVRFDSVDFQYVDDGELVLDNMDLVLHKGERIALVGESGSGKSTILNLLLRLADPVQGKVTVDGVDLRELDLASWHGIMGVVTQEPVLFNDTVTNNIRYGITRETSDEEIMAAARRASADEFIRAMPDGYDSLLGDRGVKLSGGQRQRITLARAFLRDPQILLLDEATSALDSVTERLIQEAIDELCKGRTVITVAHRLSTIRHSDRIYVLDGGKIVDVGDHDTLLESSTNYSELYAHQFAS